MSGADVLAQIQRSLQRIAKMLADLSRRVDSLERARRRDQKGGGAGAVLFADLLDVADVRYDPPEDRPDAYSLPMWVTDDEAENGGWWRAIAGRPLIAPDPFTVSGSGLISIDEMLDEVADWPDVPVWQVWATAVASGGTPGIGETVDYEDPFLVTIPEDFELPITIPSGTSFTATVDGGSAVPIVLTVDLDVTVTMSADAEVDVNPTAWNLHREPPVLHLLLDGDGEATEVARASSSVKGSDLALTSSWLFAGGVPRVRASLSFETDAYPGSHDLAVIVRAWPIPAAPPEETP